MHESREIVGLLCRWAILAVSAGGMCGLAAVSLSGAAAVPPRPEVVIPEAVWSGQGDSYVRGSLVGGELGRNASLFLSSLGGEASQVAMYAPPSIYLPVGGDHEGMNTLLLRGIPYGPAADVRASTRMLVIGPGQPVFLVDGRVAMSQEKAALPGMQGALHRLGQVVLFTGKGVRDWPQQRADLYRLGMRQVLVGSCYREENWLGILKGSARSLARAPSRLEVVTSDPTLAIDAAAAGFEVDLVAPIGLLPASMPSLHVYSSLANLQANLASRPMKE